MEWRKHVGVIGAGDCSNTIYELARNVGFEIGKNGWILVCGGLGGVMVGLETWENIRGVQYVSDPHEAIQKIRAKVKNTEPLTIL